MKDQVDSMKMRGHTVDLLSKFSYHEKIAVKDRVRNRQTAILHVAPEQLNNDGTLSLIQFVPIALLVIHEANWAMPYGRTICDWRN